MKVNNIIDYGFGSNVEKNILLNDWCFKILISIKYENFKL